MKQNKQTAIIQKPCERDETTYWGEREFWIRLLHLFPGLEQ